MRTNRFLYALGIGCTLCACSSHDEPIGGQEEPDYSKSNKYVTVAIVTSNDGTRAESGYGEGDYEDGLADEYNVNDIAFFFFDRQGSSAYTKYVTKAEFSKPTYSTLDPAITTQSTVEIELKANSVYDGVIAVLNPDNGLFTTSTSKALRPLSLEELEEHIANYAGNLTKNIAEEDGSTTAKGNFTMSNSVFINDTYDGQNSFVLYKAVPITSHNIYTKAEYEKLTQAEKDKKTIQIYVERTNAKVRVKNEPTFDAYFVEKKDGKEVKTIEVRYLDETGGTSTSKTKTIKVKPEFQGIGVTVFTKTSPLIKYLRPGLRYEINGDIANFVWNDNINKRTYWETTTNGPFEDSEFDYTSWSNTSKFNGTDAFIKYINPNTAAASVVSGDTPDETTKLMVAAQLKDDNTGEYLDLVKFSDGYWLKDYFIYHAATRTAENVANNVALPTSITEDEKTKAEDAMKAITADFLISKGLRLKKQSQTKLKAYLAALTIKKTVGTEEVYPAFFENSGLSDQAKSDLQTAVENEVQKTLDEMTSRQILYWNNGMTYFYVPIRHQGFTGLSGAETKDAQGKVTNREYLNGVVRNHVYDINISQIYGLGTPVINPGDPIDPERPDNAPESYMKAQINVLRWRIVSYDVTMH